MKRIIFTLLYDNGNFVLSRNFNLQVIGDINWLFKNYKFEKISYGLDELLIIDVSRNKKNPSEFCKIINQISKKCFIPLTAGGGIENFDIAKLYFDSGADKIFLNQPFHENISLCKKITKLYGKQSLIAGIDFKKIDDKYLVFKDFGKTNTNIQLFNWADKILSSIGAGEVLLQSIDRDGTANGLEMSDSFLNKFNNISCPIILMGGAGKTEHFENVLKHGSIDAIATANLLNFIGNTFLKIKDELSKSVDIVKWDVDEVESLKNSFNA